MAGGTARTSRGNVASMLFIGCSASLACGQVLGVDEYRTAGSLGGDGATGETGFLTGAACEACLQPACGEQLAACAADPACAEWLDGVRKHPDPMSAYVRAQAEMEAQWRRDHGEALPTTISQV